MMDKPTIAVLFGGMSSEYKVSLSSAYGVLSHWNLDRYEPIPIGITPQGVWLRYDGPLEQIRDDTWHHSLHCTSAFFSPCRALSGLMEYRDHHWITTPIDAAFPILHGPFGEDGTIQGLLELAGIPIIGCGALSSALCMDKDRAHKMAQALGIPTPASYAFHKNDPMGDMLAAAEALSYPVFVKPLRAGSSLGVSKVDGPEALPEAISHALELDHTIIVEEAIKGIEVGCAVMGTHELFTGAVDEIELEGGFFDFTEKYHLLTSKIHVPARISPEDAQRIQSYAQRLYRGLGCTGFARVDLFLQEDGTILFHEINTIPGFTEHSRFPAMMGAAGLEFDTLIEALIDQEVITWVR